MRLTDAIRLGHLNIVAHKGRSVMLMVVIAATFSLIFAINCIVQGMRANLPRIMNPVEAYYLIVNTHTQDDVSWQCAVGEQECDLAASPEVLRELRSLVEEYHGTLVQELDKMVSGYLALPQAVLQPMITQDLAKAEGKVPVVLTLGQASYLVQVSFSPVGNVHSKLQTAAEIEWRLFDENVQLVDGNIYPVGLVPSSANVSTLSLKVVDDDLNILNPLLELAAVGGGSSFAVEQAGVTGQKSGEVLVKFDNLRDALAFAESDKVCTYAVYDCKAGAYVVQDVYNVPIMTVLRLNMIQFVITGISVVLAVIAVIIMLFTSLRLIDQNAKTIALYHALGATRGDVVLIYFCYLLELCVWAAVLAVLVGMGLAAGLSLANRQKLSTVLQLAYGVKGQTLWLLGWNGEMTAWVAVMLLMAPLGIVVSLGHFTDKKLAKRLKS